MSNTNFYMKWSALTLFIALLAAGCKHADNSIYPESTSSDSASDSFPGPSTPSPSTEKPVNTVPSKLEKISFYSEALQKQMRLNVYLPPGYSTSLRYPVLYMLHGYFGTESAWMPEMQLEKEADRLILADRIQPMIIVAPQLDNSYGLNSAEKYRMETPADPVHSRYYGKYQDYFEQDVLFYVDSHYSTISSKEGRYVGGFSMGGFAALSAAFRHPELFSKVGGHSPALWTDWSRVPRMKSWLYPNKAARLDRDPLLLAKNGDMSGISVYLDCGDADDYKLYVGTKKLYEVLQSKGIPSEYHLNPGKHNRTYWKSQIEHYLLFYGAK
ncbi:alpha/beta hydrolase [Cohnella pontilimi]|nr:alpha/beta hydrolase-fold protein [Cohnella pontilimi]